MFFINVDISELKDLTSLGTVAQKAMTEAARNLAMQTHAHIVEQANQKLHTRRQMFVDALNMFAVSDDTFVVSLNASARWIDDGLPERNMIDDLLSQRNPKSKPPKEAKDGSRYRVIPFEHGGGATQNTPAQMTLLDTIKQTLKKENVPYKKLEKDESGKPKLGKLHSFDIMTEPNKTEEGPGQGWGPKGEVRQGFSEDRKSGTPFLQGLNIYQRKVKDKQGKESVKRFIMTFRIVSSKHKQQPGRWDAPALPPVNIMDEAAEWARQTWEKSVAPELLERISVSLQR